MTDRIYKSKIIEVKTPHIRDTTIVGISDLNLDNNFDDVQVETLLNTIYKAHPYYVVILGNLIHDVDGLDLETKKRLLNLLRELRATSNRTIAIPGYRDTMTLDKNGSKKWISAKNNDFVYQLYSKTDIHILSNNNIYFPGKNLNFIGLNLNDYEVDYETERDYINKVNDEFVGKINYDYQSAFNILLSHNPRNVMDGSILSQTFLRKYADLIISGYTHDGMVPDWFKNTYTKFIKLLDFPNPDNYGLIGQLDFNREILPSYSRGIVENKSNVGIICSPFTALPNKDGLIRKGLAKICNSRLGIPPQITIIEIKKDNENIYNPRKVSSIQYIKR